MSTSTQAPSGSAASAVTILVTRRARPGNKAEFELASDQMMSAARRFRGHLGAYIVKPENDSGVDHNLYHTVFAFDSEAHLSAWQASAARACVVREMEPYTETETAYRRVAGFDHWYSLPRTAQAPRWKVAIVTWLGIFPTVWATQLLLSKPLLHWPSLGRVAATTGVVIVLMTWWIAPALTRLFSRWMYPAQAAHIK